MKDKNGKVIQLGDIVRVTGSCVKSYNGTYYVENPGSPDCDSIIMKKIHRDGTISETKYNTAFFPLICFASDKRKQQEIDEYNAKNAQIEVITSISNKHVIVVFNDEAIRNRECERYYRMHDMNKYADRFKDTAVMYEIAVNRMRKGD